MFSGVFVTSVVGNPDVVSGVGDDEAWSLGFVVDNKGVGGVEETVVEQNRGKSASDLGVFGLDSVISQNIAVVSGDGVLFNGVVEAGGEFGEVIKSFLGDLGQ